VADEAHQLGDVLAVPVETYDERLTTVTADRSLSSLGLSGQARRRVVDKVAAAVILQAWLDRSSP
jgi:putative Holliday junction resolvase